MRKFIKAGDADCAWCGKELEPFEACTKGPYACLNPECQRAVYGQVQRRRYVAEGEIFCQRPGCSRPVPAGWYGIQRKLWFCGTTCNTAFYAEKHVVGTCLFCGGPIHDNPYRAGTRRFCSTPHRLRYFGERRMELRAGRFASILKEYLDGFAKAHYAPRSLSGARTQLLLFFEFLNNSGITDLDQVEPSTITDFILHEVDRGVQHREYINFASVFFNWMRFEGLRKRDNPVIARFHRQPSKNLLPRPYANSEIETMWALLRERGTELDKLAFAIGLECGLRVGEVGNVRLPDVDQASQKIFVRLPTKNRTERRPLYHSRVKACLEEWLKVRDPYCGHDHLLHNSKGRPITFSGYLQTRLRDLLCAGFNYDSGVDSFSFHRLRHTWATHLANNGVDPAVIMELGGWKSWAGMQRYVRLSRSYIESSYDAAMRVNAETLEENSSVSLVELAISAGSPSLNREKSAT